MHEKYSGICLSLVECSCLISTTIFICLPQCFELLHLEIGLKLQNRNLVQIYAFNIKWIVSSNFHDGGEAGSQAHMMVPPESGIYAAVLSNMDGSDEFVAQEMLTNDRNVEKAVLRLPTPALIPKSLRTLASVTSPPLAYPATSAPIISSTTALLQSPISSPP